MRSEPRPYIGNLGDVPVEAWEGIVTWQTLLSADRTPTAGLTVGVAEVPVGGTIDGAHHHHAHHEVYFFLSGSGRVHVDDGWHEVTAGSVVFLPGGTTHCVENHGSAPMRLLYVLTADSFDEVDYVFPHKESADS